jgi:multidrug efflux pump subunit AcrA (membrane-fusion protein)
MMIVLKGIAKKTAKPWSKPLKTLALTVSALAMACSLCACHRHTAADNLKNSTTTITVKPTSQTMHLYYKGTIAPIKVYAVLSPVAGHVSKIGFQYGEAIKTHQLLATISADTLAEDYQKQLSDYLKQKDSTERAKNDYTSALTLYRAGVKMKNDVTTALSTYNNSILALNTSRHTLSKTTRLLGIKMSSVESLSLNDVNQVTKELNKKFKNISIYAKQSGVALHPLPSSKSNNNNPNQDNQLSIGDDIKQKQLLLSIGDLHGYSTQFNVNEVDIHRFKVGQKIIVTGPAFPHLTLTGHISEVASQANLDQNGGNSGMAQFSVVAQIPHITLAEARDINIGMTAKIDVPITTKPEISIPINALTDNQGRTTVQVRNAQGKAETRPVTVGSTLISQVVITSGLKAGDRVVVPND